MPRSFTHEVPASRVVFAPGGIERVGEEAERLGGTRVMLIAGGFEAEHAKRIEPILAEKLVAHFTDVVMHVPTTVAAEAVAQATQAQVDLLVALGGGSSTGMAKAVALETGLPILAIPTTYAGSEMSSIWGLTENNRKVTGRDLTVLPKTVIYDPELTVTLPVDLSAASGMNALAHLVEGLYSPGISPILALEAEEGVRALATALPGVVADPSDIDARGDALYGAWLAGWILQTTSMGVHHKICHTLGGLYDLAHAPMHSAVLSYATDYNEGSAPEAMQALRRALGRAGFEADSAAGAIWDLATAIGAPTSLKEVGFRLENVDEAADIIVAAQPTNPRPVTPEGIRALLVAAYDGTRPGASVS